MEENKKHLEKLPRVQPGQTTDNPNDSDPNHASRHSNDPRKMGSSNGEENDKDNINNDSFTPPKEFLESQGRFARLPEAERKALAAKGGAATKGISKKHYTKCVKCELRGTCRRAYEESKKKDWADDESRCVYEIEGRQSLRDNDLREYKAFISHDPTDLLAKIQSTYKLLEEEVTKDTSYTKLTNLLYLLMNIYRLKFGEKAFIMNVNKNLDTNASLDIKAIMKEMRSQQNKDDAIDIDPHPVSNNAEEDE